MSTARNPSQRLIELERILAQITPARASEDETAGSVAAHLAGVPADRIRQLTSALQRGLKDTTDEIDVVTMRLLLNDYIVGVGHFRAIARTAASRMDKAAEIIGEGQRFVHREQKREAQRAARRGDAVQS